MSGSRNASLALNLALLAAGMLALAYASVPLYRLFCAVTGYGGTTQLATHTTTPIGPTLTVTFNADHDPSLPWRFSPNQPRIETRAGQATLIYYTARNDAKEPVTGRAVYNVTPFSAGAYFSKIQCFCFEEQTLAPGQTAEMPVLFAIDPQILTDPDTKDIRTITLSYTFFPVKK